MMNNHSKSLGNIDMYAQQPGKDTPCHPVTRVVKGGGADGLVLRCL